MQHREVLTHVHCGTIERQAEHVLDHDLMRQPDAEREPAVHRDLSRQRLRGEHHRVARVRRDDTGAEFDARHGAPGDGERGERIDAEDLRRPRRAEAVGHRPLERRLKIGEGIRTSGLAEKRSDAHAAGRYPELVHNLSPLVIHRATASPWECTSAGGAMQVDGAMVASELRRRRVGRRQLIAEVEAVGRSTWVPGELRAVPTGLLVLAAVTLARQATLAR